MSPPLIQGSVPQLNGGVSRMADIIRVDSQLEEQFNGLSDIIDSVGTRPPAAVLRELNNFELDPAILFETDLTGTTLWVLVHDLGSSVHLSAWEADGTFHNIDTVGTIGTYLDSGSVADGDIQVLQTGGRIYILNRKVTTLMDAALTPVRDPEVMIWCRQSAASIRGVLSITNVFMTPLATLYNKYSDLSASPTNGEEVLIIGASSKMDATDHSTAILAEELYKNNGTDDMLSIQSNWWAGFDGGDGFADWVISYPDDTRHPISAVDAGSIITMLGSKQASKGHKFSIEDGLGNQAIRIAGPETVDALESLPREGAPVGFHVKVVGLNSAEEDDFYVHFDGDAWVEVTGQGIKFKIDDETMPLNLFSDGLGDLELEHIQWGERSTGDTTSAPDPQFIGKEIQSMAIHKNRLALVCTDSVSMSEDAAHFNYFPSTLRQILDTDPIEFELSASGGEAEHPQVVRHCVSTPGGLLLLGENTQSIVAASEDLWAPTRVSNSILSAVEMEASVPPVRVGSDVFFLAKHGENTTLWSYRTDAAGSFLATDVSAAVPRYLPRNVAWMKGSFNEKIILMGDKDDLTTVWAYRWYDEGGADVIMQSWSKWTFPFNIMNGYFKDGNFVLLFSHENLGDEMNGVAEISFDFPGEFEDDGIDWPFCLDYKVNADDMPGWTIVYDVATNITTYTDVDITVPGTTAAIFDDDTGVIEIQPDVDHASIPGRYDLEGDTTGSTRHVVFGVPFEFSIQLSKIYRKRQDGKGSVVPVQTGRTQLRRIYPLLTRSGPVDVRITSEGRASVTKVLPAFKVGESAVYPFVPPAFRRESVDVHGDAAKIKIEFLSAYLTPVTITGYDWEALYYNRAQQRANSTRG